MIKPTTKNEVSNCFRRIVILSNYRERCEAELFDRLVNKEKFSKDVYSKAIKKAKYYDIVNDERYAELYAFSKSQACRGIDGIIRHFSQMNIDYESMPSVIEIIGEAREREFQSAIDYLKRHPSRSKNVYASYVRKLTNRGFSTSLAIRAANYLL